MFVKKKDYSMHICINYRRLNEMTTQNRYVRPHIQNRHVMTRIDCLFDQLQGATVFSRYDLRSDNHHLRSTFTNLMNRVFRTYLDSFIIVFIDDILVQSRNREEREQFLSIDLQTFRNHRPFAKFSKCEFWFESVTFLGHVVPNNGIIMDPKKIKAIYDWARPTSPTEVCNFIGLADYYRWFIERFSTFAAPMTRLTQKKVFYSGSMNAGQAFKSSTFLFDFLTFAFILTLQLRARSYNLL